ncbi:chemotaxis-specific protein-glutamate methyltransferase CheB [bacterium]|nr:chemotaxis-specific protein-glutamate methyltransferase CheB [bacterium]
MRIAIVNDLALAREVLRRVVLSLPGYSVAWEAADGEDAVAKAAADKPQAVLMDLVMPRLDGAEATRRIMRQSPCPILVVTATVPGHFELVYKAMGAGALDAVETPTLGPGGEPTNAGPLVARLAKLDAALKGHTGSGFFPVPATRAPSVDLPRFVAIGVSTGGPDALGAVLAALPANFTAAVLVAQHIAAEYAPALADALRPRCRLPVGIARSGDVPRPGVVYLAATEDHLELAPDCRLRYTPTPKSAPYRPSADVLFSSLAARAPRPGVAVILTGMGTDGAEGMLKLRQSGWYTIAQNEASCVVYGMPKAAVERRAACEVLPLDLIGAAVVSQLRDRAAGRG